MTRYVQLKAWNWCWGIDDTQPIR